MMVENDNEYFRRRAAEELERSETSPNPHARAAHAALAERYRQRLDEVSAPALGLVRLQA